MMKISPPTDRDLFIDRIAARAGGHVAPLADAVAALLTHQDIDRLARRTGQSADELMAERARARMRISVLLATS
jgi:hypothetical protein